ncbi:MAG: hypothetical protein U0T36_06945 [Saprospiraceae bacterium]
MKVKIAFICLIFCTYLRVWGQEVFYNIYNYTSRESGLDMHIFELVQDSDGFMWARDYSNIGKFDGQRFTNMTNKFEQASGSQQDVYDIHADIYGKIWVSSSTGVFNYSNLQGFVRFVSPNRDQFDNVSAIADDTKDRMIFGTLKGEIFILSRITGAILSQFRLPQPSITKYISIKDDKLWVSSNKGIYLCDETGNCKELYRFKPYYFDHLFVDNRHQKIKPIQDGRILANTPESDVIIFNQNGEVEKQLHFNLSSTDKWVNDWLPVSDQNIMFATTDGIFNLDLKTMTLKQKQNEYLIKNQLYNTHLLSISKTKNNIIFIGSTVSISKLNILNEQFVNFNYKYPSKTVMVKTSPINASQWIVVTEKDGILLFNPKSLTIDDRMPLNGHTVEYAVLDSVFSILWVATNTELLNIDLKGKLIKKIKKVGRTSSMILYHDTLWHVSDGKPFALDIKRLKSTKLDSGDNFESVGLDSEGHLFFGGSGLKLSTAEGLGKLEISQKFELTGIHSMTADNLGNLYFVSGRRLIQYHHTSGEIKIFDQKNGLPNESLNYIQYDGHRGIWVCTRSSGLCRFDIYDLTSSYFKESEGLADNIYLFGLSMVKPGIIAGHRWQFFSFYDPKKLDNLISPTSITFSDIINKNKDITSEVISSKDLVVASSNSLVSMNLGFPVFLHPSMYHLKYRLKSNENSTWSEIGEDHKLILNEISPGDYTLEVKATNAYYPDDFTMTTLNIKSLSPFYMKWWFFALCTLFSYFIVYLIYRYRQLQKKKIEDIRASISKDLHDEMGSNLSNIMLTGEMALLHNNSENLQIKHMVDKTKDVMRSMSDIVWSINPGNDSLPNIISKIQANCVEILEPMGINLIFDVDENLNDIKLDMSKRQSFYMLCKEAVNNCSKYSKATDVKFAIHLVGNKIKASIEDNGIGFDVQKTKRGNGLYNMEERAKVVGGKCQIISNEGIGTKINIEFVI